MHKTNFRMEKHAKRVILLVMLAALIGTAAVRTPMAHGQANQQITPRVIASSPAPHEEIVPDQPIQITFDQPMDQVSVTQTLQIALSDTSGNAAAQPSIPAQTSWRDDRTLTIIAAIPLTRGQSYLLIIGANAKSTAGVALGDPYKLAFDVTAALKVMQVIPAPNTTQVEAGSTITVVFSRPVVPLVTTGQQADLVQPLTLSPDVSGHGEWVNTSIYLFHPDKPLPGGTTFTVTVKPDLKDVTGSPLSAPYSWTFSTIAPQVLNVVPAPNQGLVGLDDSIDIEFNQPMDQQSTAGALAVTDGSGKAIAGKVTWDQSSEQLIFTPASRLALGSSYRISLTASAHSASGTAALSNPFSQSFTTVPYPAFANSQPPNGAQNVYPGGGMALMYNAPMDQKSFAGHIHISPAADNFSIQGGGGSQIYVSFASLPQTTYTLTVDAGVTDPYGNPVQSPTIITFTTGSLQPALNVATKGQVSLTNAYLSDTVLQAATINVQQLDVGVSSTKLTDWLNALIKNQDPSTVALPVRAFQQPVENTANQTIISKLKLAGNQGGQLPPGLYLITITSPQLTAAYPQYKLMQVLAVGTANLTLKTSPTEAMVWATDLKTGQPIRNAPITLYRVSYSSGTLEPQTIANGTTDASGLYSAAIPDVNDNNGSMIWAVAQGDGLYGLASSANGLIVPYEGYQPYRPGFAPGSGPNIPINPVPPTAAMYLYTDQPVYRPGHPVYFRGVLRDENDVTYSVPVGATVNVKLMDAQGKPIYQKDLMLTDLGTFSGEYDLPQYAPIGYYNMQVTYKQQPFYHSFQVADYRPPTYQVSATAKVNQVVAGDTISVDVAASFFFGGSVSNAKVTWNAIADESYFNYTGDGNWSFSPIIDQYVYQRQVGSGSGTTDANGHFTVSLPAGLGGVNVTQSFTVEATVLDLNNQPISGRATVTVHPAKAYVGVGIDSPVAESGKPATVKLIAIDWASKPLPNQKLRVDVATLEWKQDPKTLDWNEVKTPVIGDDLTTDANGLATYSFTPAKAGLYVVTASTRDDAERLTESGTYLYVSGPQPFNYGRGDDKGLKLVPDKTMYQPGDTASILIPSPFTGTVKALVTVERARIMKTDVIDVTGSQTYKLPMTSDDAPDVYVSVTLIAPMSDQSPNPDYRTGEVQLHTHVVQHLVVKLTPSVTTAKPGDTVHFDVYTADENGKPIAATVGVKLTDLANLSVADDNSGNIFDAFWGDHGLSVFTNLSLTTLIDNIIPQPQSPAAKAAVAADGIAPGAVPAPEAGATSTATGNAFSANQATLAPPAPIQVRSNFVDTPLWNPDVRTGPDGHGGIDVKLPDNLTTWRLDGRGISANTYAGQSTTDIISTKPLLINPATPRFFVVGDQPELAAVVNNNTGSDLSVNVTLDTKGATLTSGNTQTVNIAKNGRVRVAWQATIQNVDNVDLTFTAVSGQYNDASKPTVGQGDAKLLPVYKYVAPDYTATAGTLTNVGTRIEGIVLPTGPAAPTSGSLIVTLNPSLAAATIDGLNYLQNYPYQCVEQTISKFLPNIVTYHALQQLNQNQPKLKANLDAALAGALARLKANQHSDGGWGWFPNDQSSAIVTAYAVLGLTEAKAADLPIDQPMLDRAVRFLLGQTLLVSRDSGRYVLDTQAFLQYVLARAGNPNIGFLDSLFTQRESMNYFARAFLAQAYHLANGDPNKINALLSDLQNAAILSATGAHWEEPQRDWYNWDSDTRTTAIVLKTLVDLTPNANQSQLIPNIVRWLMVARRGDAWETTQETAWAVMGLTDWMVASGELNANYTYNVTVNGNGVGNGTASPDTLRDTKTLSVDVKNLLADQLNTLAVQRSDGPGALYYTATLAVQQPVEAITPVNRGLAFTRTYYVNGQPVTSAKIGDTITVALDITVPHDLYFAVINDPFPAGTEAVDTSLKTTSQIGKTPELDKINPIEGWGWWWFSNTELRTNEAVLTASYLPSGTYRYVYQVTATDPGTFRVIPPNGQEFYFPEVFGRGAGSLFTITP